MKDRRDLKMNRGLMINTTEVDRDLIDSRDNQNQIDLKINTSEEGKNLRVDIRDQKSRNQR